MKTVGLVREETIDPWRRVDRLQRSILKGRGGLGFHPKGVFRFSSYEEMHEWTRQQKVLAAKDLAARRSMT